MITIRIAELNIGLDNHYQYIEKFVEGYTTDSAPDFVVGVSEEEIDEEKKQLESENLPRAYVESIVLYRKIAEELPRYDAAVFHGSVIEEDGKAFIFTARSGVGKTTHSSLWLKEFGDKVRILNGDKPILRIIDGTVYACGTPWRGKEFYGVNAVRPLAGIAFLSRGLENKATLVQPQSAVMRFVSQMYLDRTRPENLLATIKLADKILSSVRLIELECNMDRQAAIVAHEAFHSPD